MISGPNEGLVVPVRRLDGKVVALKLGKDVEGDGPKYVYFSGRGGSSCGAPAHVPVESSPRPRLSGSPRVN